MFDTSQRVIDFLEAVLPDGIYDYAGAYGEPGYDLPDGKTPLVVLGSYWCRCDQFDDESNNAESGRLHDIARHYPHAFERLEENGVVFEWHDEWMVDYHTSKAYRTSADSYSWKPSVVLSDDGEWLTPDDDIEAWLTHVVNQPTRCLPDNIYGAADLEAIGFERWPDDETQFESGWHPHQTDDPADISDRIIRESEANVDIVFVLDNVGQFDIAFSAYVRPMED